MKKKRRRKDKKKATFRKGKAKKKKKKKATFKKGKEKKRKKRIGNLPLPRKVNKKLNGQIAHVQMNIGIFVHLAALFYLFNFIFILERKL